MKMRKIVGDTVEEKKLNFLNCFSQGDVPLIDFEDAALFDQSLKDLIDRAKIKKEHELVLKENLRSIGREVDRVRSKNIKFEKDGSLNFYNLNDIDAGWLKQRLLRISEGYYPSFKTTYFILSDELIAKLKQLNILEELPLQNNKLMLSGSLRLS